MTEKNQSNLIGFKLSQSCLEDLKRFQQEGESLSLVAKRQLESSLCYSTPESSIHDKLDALLRLMGDQEIMWNFARAKYAEVYERDHPKDIFIVREQIEMGLRDDEVRQYVVDFLDQLESDELTELTE